MLTQKYVAIGRLGRAPKQITKDDKKPMVVGSIAVKVSWDTSIPPIWWDYKAFGRTAERMMNMCMKGSYMFFSGVFNHHSLQKSDINDGNVSIVIRDFTLINEKNKRKGDDIDAVNEYEEDGNIPF